ncbi:hypothetical protein SAMN05444411_101596 [Lutibacter oricola]|uniref:Uncharacterized protein n=1 Tax=Lutibacter oricola TaxID=762486 RepID=A0A1H2T0S4_9FLAO|nr:hypothetical protein [Lutibacter oricola]SDW37566.1 hypothetical protein SAMN05444411_101596 [Lutibacter oricola]
MIKKIIYIIVLNSFLGYSQKNVESKNASFKLKEIALLSIEPNNSTVMLNLGSPDFSGDKVKTTSVNNEKWINFTSAISNSSSKRNLLVKIEDGNIPNGIELKLKTDNYTGNGKGQLGVKTNIVSLNKSSQTIISDIGGAYTGSGTNNGYKITYLLDIYDYKLLNRNNSQVLTISLTLTDF